MGASTTLTTAAVVEVVLVCVVLIPALPRCACHDIQVTTSQPPSAEGDFADAEVRPVADSGADRATGSMSAMVECVFALDSPPGIVDLMVAPV